MKVENHIEIDINKHSEPKQTSLALAVSRRDCNMKQTTVTVVQL